MTDVFTRAGLLCPCSRQWIFDERFQLYLRIKSKNHGIKGRVRYAWIGNVIENIVQITLLTKTHPNTHNEYTHQTIPAWVYEPPLTFYTRKWSTRCPNFLQKFHTKWFGCVIVFRLSTYPSSVLCFAIWLVSWYLSMSQYFVDGEIHEFWISTRNCHALYKQRTIVYRKQIFRLRLWRRRYDWSKSAS